MDQPGLRRTKAAGVEIERTKVGLEVDVEPLVARGAGVLRCEANDPRSDALALPSAVRLRVDEKGMVSAVRDDVGEADQALVRVAGGDPAETVRANSIPQPTSGLPS